MRKILVALAFVLGLSAPAIGKEWPARIAGVGIVCDEAEDALNLYLAMKQSPNALQAKYNEVVSLINDLGEPKCFFQPFLGTFNNEVRGGDVVPGPNKSYRGYVINITTPNGRTYNVVVLDKMQTSDS